MKFSSRSSAQQRVDQIDSFNRELAELTRDQVLVLSDAQRQAVEQYQQGIIQQLRKEHDVDSTQSEKQLSWGMRIASFLGAVAMAASLFFMFYQFWGRFGTVSQVTILVAAPLLAFIATVIVAGKDKSGYFTKLIGLVTFACFVLNISMLGQIFNITPSDNALIVWAALALLLAYAYDVRLLQVAAVLCIIAFVSARVGTWSGVYWIHFGYRPENFFPVALLLFFLPQWIDHRRFTGFALSYRVFGMITLFLPVLILSNWGQASYLNANPNRIEIAYQLVGFSVSAAAIAYGIRRGYAHVVNTGTVFFFIFLYTKFFDWWWNAMPKYVFFLILSIISIAVLVLMTRLRKTGFMKTLRAPT